MRQLRGTFLAQPWESRSSVRVKSPTRMPASASRSRVPVLGRSEGRESGVLGLRERDQGGELEEDLKQDVLTEVVDGGGAR